MEIFIDPLQHTHDVDLPQLHDIALEILHALKCPERCELSIALVDDQEIHRLNQEYRGIDRPTDVLSFAQQETVDPTLIQPHTEDVRFPLLLGDVILSVETTARQAREHQTSFDDELYFLLIHGILHLLGYDHQESHDAEKMEALEQQLLTTIGHEKRTLVKSPE